MKVSNELLKKIMTEERIRAVVESKLPWSKIDFFQLLNEAKWWEKLDPKSTAYQIAVSAGKEWDAASEKSHKRLAMTKEEYMKQAVYDNARAGHKMATWNPYEREGSLPDDDPPRSTVEIIMKGYPEENLPSRKISSTREIANFMRDKSLDSWREYEAYVSPYGYIHGKVKGHDAMGGSIGKNWVYVGDWAIDRRGNMVKTDKSGPTSRLPPVTYKSLEAERESPSPDRDAVWGKGDTGSVDVQDPTMEEQLIDAIREQMAAMRQEQ